MALNVFASLEGYSTHQAENYLTECFVFTLQLLHELERDTAVRVINLLCNWPDDPGFTAGDGVVATTQFPVGGGGIVDIALRSPGRLVFVEVKDSSPLGPRQLESYLEQLLGTDVTHKRLVLLSRSRSAAMGTELAPSQFHHVCWFEVHRWLKAAQLVDPVARHIVSQFIEYLEVRNMALARIGWEYGAGVSAMVNFGDMVWAAAEEAIPGAKLRASTGWTWRGTTINQIYYLGVRYSAPTLLVFEKDSGNNPTFKRDLDLERTYFLAMSTDEQFHHLVEFIGRAYGEACAIFGQSLAGNLE